MAISGKWEGKLIDATGPTAGLEVNVKEKGGAVTGDFSLFFFSERDGCAAGERRLVQSGPINGRYNKVTGKVNVTYEVTVGLEPAVVVLDGVVRDGHGHARQAIVGCYGPKKDDRGALTLEGGGVVLWQYAR